MKSSPRIILTIASAFAVSLLLGASYAGRPQSQSEGDDDRFVRLMNAKSVRMMEIDGKNYRKAEGPARFLHNDTWLICDTALWNVEDKVIYAIGNVRIEQENTELVSDRLTYLIDSSVAQFRGSLVELRDKDQNTLRTRNLDYYTDDSVAVFRSGASMRDKDGQIIESRNGKYESRLKMFTFKDNVNMFTDSIFVKTSILTYHSPKSLATFPEYTEAWKDESMLSGDMGWYDNEREMFFFRRNVHVLSADQEGWCDSLYYSRRLKDVEMLGNTQVTDAGRGISAIAGRVHYTDSKKQVVLHRKPVVFLAIKEKADSLGNTPSDTLYMRADTMVYWTVPRCAVDSAEVQLANARLATLAEDPVANIRAKAAEAAAKARQEALDNDPNTPPELRSDYKKASREEGKPDRHEKKLSAPGDSLSVAADSLTVAADSLAVTPDSLSAAPQPVPDSTGVGFARAVGKVKLFRKKMQVVCDSLRYSDLDSLARLFKEPIVWNDIRHQYMSDSLFLQISDGRMTKAALMSEAFIHIKEDENHYDQIRAAEMTAFFDDSTRLSRFDAMGSANALFFMKEKERVSTANRKEATMLTAEFENEEIKRITYYESPKSNAYPVAQMRQEDKFLKGYKWSPHLRPFSPASITNRSPRKSQRLEYESHPRAEFRQTEIFFKGYMAKIYREIERSDSLRKVASVSRPIVPQDTLGRRGLDSTEVAGVQADAKNVVKVDSLRAPVDSLALRDSIARSDSLKHMADSLKMRADSIYNAMTPAQRKAFDRQKEREKKRAAREAEMAKRQAAREARWAELDERDRLRKEAKEAAKQARKEEKKRKEMEALLKRKQEEDELYEQYKQKYLLKYGYGKLKNQRGELSE